MTADLLVTTAGSQAPDIAPEVAVPVLPVTSPLAGLRKRREEILNALTLTMEVPEWDTGDGLRLFVTYRPADPAKVIAAAETRRKASESKATSAQDKEEWITLANADVLVSACVEVFAMEGPGEKKLSLRDGDPHGGLTRMDPDLAYALGLDPERAKAVDVCRSLYLTPGNLLAAASELISWSQQSGREGAQEYLDFSGPTRE